MVGLDPLDRFYGNADRRVHSDGRLGRAGRPLALVHRFGHAENAELVASPSGVAVRARVSWAVRHANADRDIAGAERATAVAAAVPMHTALFMAIAALLVHVSRHSAGR
jgi:hypothetical protein